MRDFYIYYLINPSFGLHNCFFFIKSLNYLHNIFFENAGNNKKNSCISINVSKIVILDLLVLNSLLIFVVLCMYYNIMQAEQ